MDKPDALRLADEMDQYLYSVPAHPLCTDAAVELRRLHQFAEEQIGRATAAEAALQMTKVTHALKIGALERQRDALLEALRWIDRRCPEPNWADVEPHRIHIEMSHDAGVCARAAIAAVEGEKK